jgi:hypothetical protein
VSSAFVNSFFNACAYDVLDENIFFSYFTLASIFANSSSHSITLPFDDSMAFITLFNSVSNGLIDSTTFEYFIIAFVHSAKGPAAKLARYIVAF